MKDLNLEYFDFSAIILRRKETPLQLKNELSYSSEPLFINLLLKHHVSNSFLSIFVNV